jgi:hypothetical protein
MGWQAHETIRHDDGSEHHIRRRRKPGERGEQSYVIRVTGAEGLTREIWHEVIDHRGQVVHRHLTFRRPGRDGA